MTNNKASNRLIHEKSAYLLQHAHNPVDWFPWCDEAFEKAKKEDKPVFLSIGYSTCHWCHVMEKESFEDAEVAEILNKHFVSIKVDREERPDIDSIYMTVCQMLTGSGGWPMSIIMDSDKKPFFAGTYFPKNDRGGMIGFISLLESISELWQNDKSRIATATVQILKAIKNDANHQTGKLTEAAIDKAIKYFKQNFDKQYGGFGSAPKFPSPHNLLFLLRYYYKTQDEEVLKIIEKTLDSMYRGGIYDHIGFGFSRYSTDEKWLVPHFEKMLYDNALLSMVYTEAYQATKNEQFAKTAKEVFEYIKRDMTSPEGSFYSAEDADSEGVEGKFYVFTPTEIAKILGNEDGKRFCTLYDITAKGNFEGENIPNLIGKNLTKLDMDFAKDCKHKLFKEREKRIHPFKDKKILTSWNGLMIASLSLAGRVFEDKDYVEQAVRCARSVTDHITADRRLFADDYSFLIWGLIELYEANFDEEYLKKAIELTDVLLNDFWDNDSAGLFLYGVKSEQLLIRPKEIYDGATPSANSVMAYNLLRLSRLTGKYELEDKAQAVLNHFAKQIEQMPAAYSFSLVSLLYLNSASKEVVIVSQNTEQSNGMIKFMRENYLPFMTCLLKTPEHKNLENYAEFIKGYETLDGQCTAYICEHSSCHAPTADLEQFIKLIT